MQVRAFGGLARNEFLPYLAPDDGAGSGGGAVNPEGAKPTDTPPDPDEAAKASAKERFEKNVLPKLTDEERALYNERMRVVDATLDKERGTVKTLEKKLSTLKEELRADLRLELATERAKQAKEGESSKSEIDAVLLELNTAKAQLEERTRRDELRDAIRTSGLTQYEDIVLKLRFGKPEDAITALELFKTVRTKDITEDVERRFPSSRPPQSNGVRPAETPDAKLTYNTMQKK